MPTNSTVISKLCYKVLWISSSNCIIRTSSLGLVEKISNKLRPKNKMTTEDFKKSTQMVSLTQGSGKSSKSKKVAHMFKPNQRIFNINLNDKKLLNVALENSPISSCIEKVTRLS